MYMLFCFFKLFLIGCIGLLTHSTYETNQIGLAVAISNGNATVCTHHMIKLRQVWNSWCFRSNLSPNRE